MRLRLQDRMKIGFWNIMAKLMLIAPAVIITVIIIVIVGGIIAMASCMRHIDEKGLKYVIERIWEGSQDKEPPTSKDVASDGPNEKDN